MPTNEPRSEQMAGPYDELRAVDWARLLAEQSQRLDQLFLESIQPFVNARIRLLDFYGKTEITAGPSGMKVRHILPPAAQKLDDQLVESIEWLRERFNHPANPSCLGTGHLVAGTQHNIVGRPDSESEGT